MFAAEVEFKSYMRVRQPSGDWADVPAIVSGVVSVEPSRAFDPEVLGVYALGASGQETRVALASVHPTDLRVATEELLAVFSDKIDFDYQGFCSEMAAARWADWRASNE